MLDFLIFIFFKKVFFINNESLENLIVGGINIYIYIWEIYIMCMYNCIVYVLYMLIDLIELIFLYKYN